jgi:hypothetical protein
MPYQRHIFQQFNEEEMAAFSGSKCTHASGMHISKFFITDPPTHPFEKRQRKRKGGLRFRETAVRLHTTFWGQFKAVRASAWQLQSKAVRRGKGKEARPGSSMGKGPGTPRPKVAGRKTKAKERMLNFLLFHHAKFTPPRPKFPAKAPIAHAFYQHELGISINFL